eukprot:Mrub_06226.p1 GENE.Mrub_06226~~Mrub_06226.p1  ORF type:complete len:335 (+),score=83.83 Mrub_06226:61-1005(+)
MKEQRILMGMTVHDYELPIQFPHDKDRVCITGLSLNYHKNSNIDSDDDKCKPNGSSIMIFTEFIQFGCQIANLNTNDPNAKVLLIVHKSEYPRFKCENGVISVTGFFDSSSNSVDYSLLSNDSMSNFKNKKQEITPELPKTFKSNPKAITKIETEKEPDNKIEDKKNQNKSNNKIEDKINQSKSNNKIDEDLKHRKKLEELKRKRPFKFDEIYRYFNDRPNGGNEFNEFVASIKDDDKETKKKEAKKKEAKKKEDDDDNDDENDDDNDENDDEDYEDDKDKKNDVIIDDDEAKSSQKSKGRPKRTYNKKEKKGN